VLRAVRRAAVYFSLMFRYVPSRAGAAPGRACTETPLIMGVGLTRGAVSTSRTHVCRYGPSGTAVERRGTADLADGVHVVGPDS